ncbi:gamma-parvin isoform X2 [Polypterus senegalus]|nr:gamma-parvin isoform X2 [Polypterus senegalus]
MEGMDQEISEIFAQASLQASPCEDYSNFLGGKNKLIHPQSLKDARFEQLKEVLISWINDKLKKEHIVIQSLEKDLYDGLILHHLFVKLSGVELKVEEIALTESAQKRKLTIILEAVNEKLNLPADESLKWSVNAIYSCNLLANLHLLIAMARCFQPELVLPPNLCLKIIVLEVNKNGIKSETILECITGGSTEADETLKDPIEELLKLAPEKVNTVKQAILHFVNKNLEGLGLRVNDMNTQFADGVMLILLIGQLGGYFINLNEYCLTPSSNSEMLLNVTFALDLLSNDGLLPAGIEPQDIVSQDETATLKVLYSLFRTYK